MNLHITGHHLEITPALHDYLQSKFARIGNHFDHVIDIKVTLSVEKLAQKNRRRVPVRPFLHLRPTRFHSACCAPVS